MHPKAWAVLGALALLAGCQPPPPDQLLQPDDLRAQVGTLAATAAEAQLFAGQLARHDVNRAFAWVHQQALGEEAAKAAGEIGRPVRDADRALQQQALQVAAQLQLEINRAAQVRNAPEQLAGLRSRLAALHAQAEALEQGR